MVLKSPPYNRSSNGQAERAVRIVKDVLKKFLLEPEERDLYLEDQISLFLFNYRNDCLVKDGSFSSHNVFKFEPKTLINLINPQKTYKNFLATPQNNDASEPKLDKRADARDVLLDKLNSGDEVWYKNSNSPQTTRWIKAIFIKRYSQNLFQIQVGSVVTTAHRTQLKVTKGGWHSVDGTQCFGIIFEV